MKKSLFIMALGAIALTSCSQDEVLEVKQDAIAFTAFTENLSRATAKTDLGTADNFVVYANENVTGGKAYIQGVVATTIGAGGGTGEFKLASTYYWPVNALNFYCISPASLAKGTITPANNIPAISTYTVDSDHAEDLLYSVAKGLKRGATTGNDGKIADVDADGVADINFRHALSMIQFKFASDVTYDLDVTVSEIQLVNVAQTGAYALPEYTTSPWLDSEDETADDRNEVDNGNGVADDANKYRTRGAWTIASDAYSSTYTWAENYSATPATPSAAGTAYFLLPQTVTASSIPTGDTAWEGAYFKINCVISKDNVTVYSGQVQIPVATAGSQYTWKEGYKYLYTFTFGKGGGYYPDSNDPAIVPISFDITVDEMQNAEESVEVQVP